MNNALHTHVRILHTYLRIRVFTYMPAYTLGYVTVIYYNQRYSIMTSHLCIIQSVSVI